MRTRRSMLDRERAIRIYTEFDWPTFVRTLRSEPYLDCTQIELSRRLGVSVSSVSKWETGRVRPRVRHRWELRRLATRAGYRSGIWPKVSRAVEI